MEPELVGFPWGGNKFGGTPTGVENRAAFYSIATSLHLYRADKRLGKPFPKVTTNPCPHK